jgi:RNA polymerase-binding transcription factor DksA
MPKSDPAKTPAKPKSADTTKVEKPAGVAAPVKASGDKRAGKSGGNDGIFYANEGNRDAESDAKLSPFLRKQKERLVHLRDNMLDSMTGVAKDTLRSRAEGSEASAFGMHQADAGSDAYDRDFALSLLSQEQDALYEIEEALKRIESGTYGMCEMSGKPIAHARLEAIPFARYTVECQSQIEKQTKMSRTRVPVTSLFGLTDGEETEEREEEESTPEPKE